jgi:hypothetical protein
MHWWCKVTEGLLFFQWYVLDSLVAVRGSGIKQNYTDMCKTLFIYVVIGWINFSYIKMLGMVY